MSIIVSEGDYIYFSYIPMNYNVKDIDWSSDEEDNVQEVPLKATKENYHNMVKSLGNKRWEN